MQKQTRSRYRVSDPAEMLRLLHTLSLSDVRHDSDRMFVQGEFVAIQHLTGKHFTYDACCSDSGVSCHCTTYSFPASSFLQANGAGHYSHCMRLLLKLSCP